MNGLNDSYGADDLLKRDNVLVVGNRAFDVLERQGMAMTCTAVISFYSRLGQRAGLGVEAWRAIVNEVDAMEDRAHGLITRGKWMLWLTQLRERSCTPYQIGEVHEELVCILNDLRQAESLKVLENLHQSCTTSNSTTSIAETPSAVMSCESCLAQ